MADVLTHLRELTVGFYFYNERKFEDITPDYFLEICRNNIIHCSSLKVTQISGSREKFNEDELCCISNGLKLGSFIKKYLNINQTPPISWLGSHTHSDSAIDLIVSEYSFSLKEESFILENMGLYKLINVLMGKEIYARGLHVFEEFSSKELNSWFEVTRDLLISVGPSKFSYDATNYKAIGKYEKDKLTLQFHSASLTEESIISNFSKVDYKTFNIETKPCTREKIFSKWIKVEVEKTPQYQEIKTKCARVAGRKIQEILKPSIGKSPASLLRFFRIQEQPYYYAKVTEKSIQVYKVPALKDATNDITIKDIFYDVPKSQLNIYTKIINNANGKSITFRNELRYSHGQLNGTPEAKLYMEDGDLSTVYIKVN